MAELGRQAHHRGRGERTPLAGMDEPVENRCFALWQAVRTGTVRAHGTPSPGPARFGLDQVAGHVVEINLSVKMADLWPALRFLPAASRSAFQGELRQWLRASGNAVCVRRPSGEGEDRRMPVWWIRDEWRDAVSVPIFRSVELELTYAERRLSATEAGEDRSPAPVSVRTQEGSEPVPSVGGTGSGDAPWARLLRGRLLAILKDAAEPMYLVEFQRLVRVNATDTRRALNALVAEGVAFTRQEVAQERPTGTSGRHRSLYWHSQPVPRRRNLMAYKSEAMDMVAALAPGEKLPFAWMPDVDKDEIRQMVEAGLVEFVDEGRAVRLSHDSIAAKERAASGAPTTPPTAAPPSAAPPTAMPPRPPRPGPPHVPPRPTPRPPVTFSPAAIAVPTDVPTDLASALTALIDAQVQARMGEIVAELAEERAARQRLETSLIEARAEASEQRARAEKRASAIKAMLGD